MAIITIIKLVKQVHPQVLSLVKVGKFYHAYGKDAYILSYLFGYKIKDVGESKNCGFSDETLNKVIARLENEKIDYMLLENSCMWFCDNAN